MCGALWEKYHHLDGNLLVVPPFTLGSRRPSHGFASYCDKYSLDTNVMPFQVHILCHLIRTVTRGGRLLYVSAKGPFIPLLKTNFCAYKTSINIGFPLC